MPFAHRVTDLDSGHQTWPPSALAQGSPNYMVNGLALGRLGDVYIIHCSTDGRSSPEPKCHVGHVASGSTKFMVNGIPAARQGDTVSCGGTAVQCSPNMIIGG